MATGNPKVIFIARNQSFDFTLNGLVPLTRHYVYFERQRQADALCAPKGGSVGQALVTDANGKLELTFYYNSGLPTETNSLEAAQNLANAIAGLKELVVTNLAATTIDESFKAQAISWVRTFLRIQVFLPAKSEIEANPLRSIEGTVAVAKGI